jgi:hypothetical protein
VDKISKRQKANTKHKSKQKRKLIEWANSITVDASVKSSTMEDKALTMIKKRR